MTPPSELETCLIAGHIGYGRSIAEAANRVGIDIEVIWSWLAAGRERTCPACTRLVSAIRLAGETHDHRALQAVRHGGE